MNKGKVVQVEGKEIALFRVGETVSALDNLCPHEGGPLGHGLVKENIVTCPWHLWEFDLRTGTLKEDPSIKVECFGVKVRGDEVFLDVASLVEPLRISKSLLQRLSNGETMESLAQEYRLSPEQVDRIATQVRIGERLIWLGELFQKQGKIYSQDFLKVPYRDLVGLSYGAQEKLEELIDLL